MDELVCLLQYNDVVMVQETHVTEGLWSELNRGAYMRSMWVLGRPSGKPTGGLLSFCKFENKDLWQSKVFLEDVAQRIICKNPIESGIIVIFHPAARR